MTEINETGMKKYMKNTTNQWKEDLVPWKN